MEIKLTNYELFSAAMIGGKRQIEAVSRRLPDKHGFNGIGWDVHIEGAAGEMAVAKALGLYWNGSINTFKEGGDVSGLEVRTRSKHSYDLLVRPDDHSGSVFVLVTGKSPSFRVVGWMLGKDAKQDKYLQTYGNRPPAYFVPQSDLHNINTLRV